MWGVWGAWGIGMMLITLVLRQRYARGKINTDGFEARKRELAIAGGAGVCGGA